MDIDNHTPSITHLREFARARHGGRKTHVAQDRMQVSAPRDDRVFAFVYEKLITAIVKFVHDGCRGRALEKAAEEASDRMKPSYSAAARGLGELLPLLAPRAIERRQRNTVVADENGVGLVSIRIPLILEMPDGSRWATHIYFSESALTEAELMILDTAVSLAVGQIDDSAQPSILMARAGILRQISSDATSPGRLEYLRTESRAYRAEWNAVA